MSCRKLEAVAHVAVAEGFPDALKRGDLIWQTVNIQEAQNRHFISEYGVFSRSLVLVKVKNGKPSEYKHLSKAWELLRDESALKEFVQSEVRAYLAVS